MKGTGLQQNFKPRPIKKILKIAKRILVAVLLLFILLLLLFSIPAVQTSIAGKLIDKLNEQYDVNIDVEKIGLSYNGSVFLEKVLVLDHHQDTLIYANELQTSLLGLSGVFANNPDLGGTDVSGLIFNIKRYKGEENDNFAVFTRQFQTDTLRPKKPFRLDVEHINIIQGSFSYIDENLPSPDIMILENLNLDASDFVVEGGDIMVNIGSMNADEGRGLRIENLSVDYAYTPNEMIAKGLTLKTPTSLLKANVELDYTLEEFSDFENKVDFNVVFEKSKISLEDLNVFYDGFGENDAVFLEGNLNGPLNDFVLSDFHLNGMDRSVIDGNLKLKGMFSGSSEQFRITGELNELSSNYYDLMELLPEALGNLPKDLNALGNVRLEGFVEVTPVGVETNSTIFTQLGTAVANLELGDLNDPDFATYKGNLSVEEFDLGNLLKSESLGLASFDLYVDGTGFDQTTLNTSIKGEVSSLEFNDYRYENIDVLGVVNNAVFNGKVVGDDPNFQFVFNGIVDASQKINRYNFDLGIEHANLNALNFVARDELSVLKGDISMNMEGTGINDATGSVLLSNTSYRNQRDTYVFEKLLVTSSFDEQGERSIEVNSPDVINGKIEGKFDLEEIPALFQNAIASLYTNYRPTTTTTNQYLIFNFDIYNKIVEVFFPEIEFAPNTYIKGGVESDESEFELTFKSPQIKAFGNTLDNINVQVDNTNPLFNAYIEIDSVSTDVYNVSDFNLINVTLRDTLFIRSEFHGGENNNDEFNLSLYHTINKENQSVVGIRKSDIKFKKSVWYLNEEKDASNRIIFEDNFQNLRVDSLVMSHENQEMRLSGVKRDSTYKDFKVAFEQVDLEKITPAIDSLELRGTVNGNIQLLQENDAYFPRSSLTIDSISVNEVPYGNLSLNIEGNENLTNYNISALLKNEQYDFLKANGTLNVSGENSNIDLNVALNKFKLSAFSALGGDVITDIRGLASGNASITGSYKNPNIDGKIILDKTGLRIPYLNVDFDFKDQAVVNLSEQQFIFEEIPIEDTKYQTKGVLDGSISHENFKDWELDLSIDTDRLLVLNTEGSETSLYYGTAFISGGASIAGPTDELVINVDATTEEGTVFKIPLNDTKSIGDNSFIYFLSPDEKAARLEGKEIFIEEIKGMEINFDLNVTRDALVEIVVDPVSGSTLRGRGAGILRIEINTNGKFNMWGDFLVYEGVYNFKYAGLVQKEFIVESGGSINWNGSPVRADLNVRAIYKTQANPAVLLENPSFNRQIPVEVVIALEDQIIQPDISFEIEYPNLSSMVKSELEYRINDEQSTELNALTLITTGTFYSEHTLSQAPAGNLLERASSLVNDIFADNGKFDLGLSYVQGDRTLDQAAADRFGVTVSTKIGKNIIFDGQVGVPIGGVSESLVIGNAEISFLLNEEGTLRFKVFNRENNIRYIGEEIGYSQGLGLSYSVDFDTFEELVRKILNKEIKTENVEQTVREEIKGKSVAPEYLKFPGQ